MTHSDLELHAEQTKSGNVFLVGGRQAMNLWAKRDRKTSCAKEVSIQCLSIVLI